MNKKDKIEYILNRANKQFIDFNAAKKIVKDKLFSHNLAVTEFEKQRYNIQRELFKLKFFKFLACGFASILIFVLLGGGIVYAADFAAPGDILYPLDRKIEAIRLRLAKSPDARSRLEIRFLEERKRELEKIRKSKLDGKKEELLLKEINSSFQEAVRETEQNLNQKGDKKLAPKRIKIMRERIKKLEEINNLVKSERNKGHFKNNFKK